MADISRSYVGHDTQLPNFFFYSGDVVVGNNKSMASIVNESGSGKKVCIRKIRLINITTSAVTGTVVELELRRITSHTGGTTITPEKADTLDTLPSQITNRVGATVSGESATIFASWHKSADDWGSGTLDMEGMQAIIDNVIPAYTSNGEQKPITLREGEGITIKCATNTTAGIFEIQMEYTVE
jgi:hypothetical protein